MLTKKILSIVALIMSISPMLSFATEKSFHSGALVIPMNSAYQPDGDGGLLEAYGLVFELLANDITIYWIIDENKTSRIDPDVIITDINVNPVANIFNHDGSVGALAGITTSITYSAAPFIIANSDEADVIDILANTASDWSVVDMHKINAPFTANVYRQMTGTPPKIALMNSTEDPAKGNASILESYVRLAGICSTTYTVVTPNQIRDGILETDEYDLLWAPHWTGYDSYAADVETIVTKIADFLDNGKSLFAECASIEVFEHSANGQFLSTNGFGHNGVAKAPAGGLLVYDNITSPFSQIGDLTYLPTGGHLHNWRPFRTDDPYNFSISPTTPPESAYNSAVSRYTYYDLDGDTNTTNDQWDYYVGGRKDGDASKGYILYLGGHKYASCSGGGGAGGGNLTPGTHELEFEFKKDFDTTGYEFKFEFLKNITDEVFTITFNHSTGSTTVSISKSFSGITAGGDPLDVDFTQMKFKNNKIEKIYFNNISDPAVDTTLTSIDISWTNGDAGQKIIKIEKKKPDPPVDIWNVERTSPASLDTADFVIGASAGEQYTFTFHHAGGSVTATNMSQSSHNFQSGTPLEVDFRTAAFSGKKIEKVYLNNVSNPAANITVTSIDISWTGGPGDQKIKKIKDKSIDEDLWNHEDPTPAVLDTVDITLASAAAPAGPAASCTDNSDCTASNVGAVRYILNTLFNLQFTIVSNEFIRSTPVISDNILYQGTFEYPSYKGHFKAIDVTTGLLAWNARDHIPADGSRTIFTYINGTKEDFTVANINDLRTSLDLTPVNGDDTDELDVIKRVRGLEKTNNVWGDTSTNKLGGIEHSAAAIIGPDDKISPNRIKVAYIGDLNGMLHAFDLDNNGTELWAFIPGNVLDKLKNDRTDPNSQNDYAAVDASPTARNVYIDHDNDGLYTWRTVITCGEGKGGNSVFVIDVTDPVSPIILWEKTDTGTGAGYLSGMGNVFRATISKVEGSIKYSIITGTNYAVSSTENGGLHVYSHDLGSGDLNWQFSTDYSSTINDIPGAIASYDLDNDSFANRVVVGDMNGRLWELDVNDGTNPNGADLSASSKVYLKNSTTGGVQEDKTSSYNVPLYNAGVSQPITASPSVIRIRNHIVVVFGTGGADWADENGTYSVIAVDATDKVSSPTYAAGAGTQTFKIDLGVGEKVWSSPTVAAGQLYFSTAFGKLENEDPNPATSGNTGNVYGYNISGSTATQTWKQSNVGQVRSSVFVSDEHLYLSTLGGNTLRIGSGTTGNPLAGGQVKATSWKDLSKIKSN